jgi:hypothetical protein
MAGLLRVLRTGLIGLMGLMGRVVHRQDYCERWTPNWQMWTPIEDDDEDSLPRRRLGEGGERDEP